MKYPTGWDEARTRANWEADPQAQAERVAALRAWDTSPTSVCSSTLTQGRSYALLVEPSAQDCTCCVMSECGAWNDRDECGHYRRHLLAGEYFADHPPVPSPPRKGRKAATRKPSKASQELAAARARIADLERQLAAALRTTPEPDASSVEPDALPANLTVEPWTRDDGREYLTLTRTNRKGYQKRFAIPREVAGAVASQLVRA